MGFVVVVDCDGLFLLGVKLTLLGTCTGTGSTSAEVATIVPNSLTASVTSVAGEFSDAVRDVELISEPFSPLIATSIALSFIWRIRRVCPLGNSVRES